MKVQRDIQPWYTPRERERYNLVVKGERSEYRQEPDLVQVIHRYIYPCTAKGIEIRRAGKTQWYTPDGRQRTIHRYNPGGQKGKTRTGQAETLTRRGHARSYSERQGSIIRRAARPSQRGKQRPPPRQAETLTLEGANQHIKESGHRSRRPPAHKGYNQFTQGCKEIAKSNTALTA